MKNINYIINDNYFDKPKLVKDKIENYYSCKSKNQNCITKDKNIALAILTADCAPVFLFDKDSTIISSIHIGWKGCLNNIIKNTLEKILSMNIFPTSLIAIIGPCLALENFEVSTRLSLEETNEQILHVKIYLALTKKQLGK